MAKNVLQKYWDGAKWEEIHPITKATNVITDSGATVESHLAEYASFETNTNQSIEQIEKELENYNSYSSLKDDNGIFTVVEYKRANTTLYMKSTLSNADAEGNYQTLIWEFYDDVGGMVISSVTWTITYDEDGNIVSKVVSV